MTPERPQLDEVVAVLEGLGYGVTDARYVQVTVQLTPAVEGRIGGRVVRCMAVSAQLRSHQGYELREVDRHDMRLLDGLGSG
ncbi:nucleotidyltransferase domain-containing protein [Kribbella sp. NPDC004536]|uniref:nucleotidyltransferase domain-containing protein n=1 Tax=Kribbella sp. NPDC004536 TaxID=3364106 RepID=UPI0036BF676D